MRITFVLLMFVYINSLNAKIFTIGSGITCEYSQLQVAIDNRFGPVDIGANQKIQIIIILLMDLSNDHIRFYFSGY